jgi:hypothetical protein
MLALTVDISEWNLQQVQGCLARDPPKTGRNSPSRLGRQRLPKEDPFSA